MDCFRFCFNFRLYVSPWRYSLRCCSGLWYVHTMDTQVSEPGSASTCPNAWERCSGSVRSSISLLKRIQSTLIDSATLPSTESFEHANSNNTFSPFWWCNLRNRFLILQVSTNTSSISRTFTMAARSGAIPALNGSSSSGTPANSSTISGAFGCSLALELESLTHLLSMMQCDLPWLVHWIARGKWECAYYKLIQTYMHDNPLLLRNAWCDQGWCTHFSLLFLRWLRLKKVCQEAECHPRLLHWSWPMPNPLHASTEEKALSPQHRVPQQAPRLLQLTIIQDIVHIFVWQRTCVISPTSKQTRLRGWIKFASLSCRHMVVHKLS